MPRPMKPPSQLVLCARSSLGDVHHLRATLGIRSWFILRVCPLHASAFDFSETIMTTLLLPILFVILRCFFILIVYTIISFIC